MNADAASNRLDLDESQSSPSTLKGKCLDLEFGSPSTPPARMHSLGTLPSFTFGPSSTPGQGSALEDEAW